MRILQLPAASRTDQFPMASLPPNPQLQCLRLLMDLVPVQPIPRPSQQFGEFVISQTPESTEIVQATKLTPACGSSDSCAEPQNRTADTALQSERRDVTMPVVGCDIPVASLHLLAPASQFLNPTNGN